MAREVVPLTEYEKENWTPEVAKRAAEIREVVNPSLRDLLVYYPGSGNETILGRIIGAHTQVQVDYRGFSFFQSDDTPHNLALSRRPNYSVQWLKVIDYDGDALIAKPPELSDGIDVLIDKCWAPELTAEYKAYVYNILRQGGYLIIDSEQRFFIEFNPSIFGLQQVLAPSGDRAKGQAFHLRVYQKNSSVCLPVQLFEADFLVQDLIRKRQWEDDTLNEEVIESQIRTLLQEVDDLSIKIKLDGFLKKLFAR